MKISVSKINDFKQLIEDKLWMTTERFNLSIMGVREKNFQADLGSAVHEMLEHGPEKYWMDEMGVYCVVIDGAYFNFNIDDPIVSLVSKIREKHKGAVHEIPMSWTKPTNYGPLEIRMRIDGLIGNKLIEYKTTKNFKYDTYKESLQWQLYLLAADLETIDYEVIELKKQPLIHSFSFHRNDIDENHINQVIDGLLSHVISNDLMPFLTK